jgi:hypothetical protein
MVWTYRNRIGLILAGVWLFLVGLMQIVPGVAIPSIIMALLAMVAGLLILLGV